MSDRSLDGDDNAKSNAESVSIPQMALNMFDHVYFPLSSITIYPTRAPGHHPLANVTMRYDDELLSLPPPSKNTGAFGDSGGRLSFSNWLSSVQRINDSHRKSAVTHFHCEGGPDGRHTRFTITDKLVSLSSQDSSALISPSSGILSSSSTYVMTPAHLEILDKVIDTKLLNQSHAARQYLRFLFTRSSSHERCEVSASSDRVILSLATQLTKINPYHPLTTANSQRNPRAPDRTLLLMGELEDTLGPIGHTSSRARAEGMRGWSHPHPGQPHDDDAPSAPEFIERDSKMLVIVDAPIIHVYRDTNTSASSLASPDVALLAQQAAHPRRYNGSVAEYLALRRVSVRPDLRLAGTLGPLPVYSTVEHAHTDTSAETDAGADADVSAHLHSSVKPSAADARLSLPQAWALPHWPADAQPSVKYLRVFSDKRCAEKVLESLKAKEGVQDAEWLQKSVYAISTPVNLSRQLQMDSQNAGAAMVLSIARDAVIVNADNTTVSPAPFPHPLRPVLRFLPPLQPQAFASHVKSLVWTAMTSARATAAAKAALQGSAAPPEVSDSDVDEAVKLRLREVLTVVGHVDGLLADDNECNRVRDAVVNRAETVVYSEVEEAQNLAVLSSMVLAIRSLSQGGCFVFLLPTLTSPFAISALFILYRLFVDIAVMFPKTTDAAYTGERVVFCKQLRQVRPIWVERAIMPLYDAAQAKPRSGCLTATWLVDPAVVKADSVFMAALKTHLRVRAELDAYWTNALSRAYATAAQEDAVRLQLQRLEAEFEASVAEEEDRIVAETEAELLAGRMTQEEILSEIEEVEARLQARYRKEKWSVVEQVRAQSLVKVPVVYSEGYGQHICHAAMDKWLSWRSTKKQ